MGIKKFRQWFLHKFHYVVEKLEVGKPLEDELSTYDHLYFDLNQNLHRAARHSNDADTVIAIALAELQRDLNHFQARKSVHLVLDGYASFRLFSFLFFVFLFLFFFRFNLSHDVLLIARTAFIAKFFTQVNRRSV
jgi:hypothetical protein